MSMTGQSSGSDDQPYATHTAIPEQEPENPQLQNTGRGAEGFEPYVCCHWRLFTLLTFISMQDFFQAKTKTPFPFQSI